MSAPHDGSGAERAAVGAGVAVAALATLELYPGLPGLDAGDFVTAAATLGVPHATGFPAYTAAAHAATLLPVANLASRVALGSAIASAVAAWAFTLAISRAVGLARGSVAVALAVAGAFVTVETLALHARVAEVYALNLALVGLALVALERLRATGDLRWRSALAVLVALGVANHATSRLFAIPLFVASIAFARAGTRTRGLGVALALGLGVLGAYAYLPAAALRGAEHAWGDPSTPARLWAHLNASDIREAYAGQMVPTVYSFGVWSRVAATALWDGLGPLLLLAPLGLVAAGRRAGIGTAALLATLLALDFGYSVVLNPMGLRDAQNAQLAATLLAALGGASIGVALEAALGRALVAAGPAERRPPLALAIGALGLGLTGVLACLLTRPAPRPDGSASDWSAEDLACVHFGLAAPRAVTVPATDSTVAAWLYSDVALDARPDLTVIGAHLLSDDAALARALTFQPLQVIPSERLRPDVRGATAAHTVELLATAAAAGRTVYWEPSGDGDALPPSARLLHRWPLGTVVGADATAEECEPGPTSLCNPHVDAEFAAAARDAAGRDGWFYREWLARQRAYRGARAIRTGRAPEAVVEFGRAATLAPWNGVWATGLAVALARAGRLEDALSVQRAAALLSPMSHRAATNAAQFAEALGDVAEAAEWRARADAIGQ